MTRVMSVITNCQGPVLVQRFLANASAQFKTRYRAGGVHQIQLVQAPDVPKIQADLDASDVILAQPLVSTPFEALQLDNLRDYAQRKGKQLILFPALHFVALTPGFRATPPGRAPGYPFGATEDLVLAACYGLGASVAAAVVVSARSDSESAADMGAVADMQRQPQRLSFCTRSLGVMISVMRIPYLSSTTTTSPWAIR